MKPEMPPPPPPPPGVDLKAALTALEALAADRGVLGNLPMEERVRLLKAAGRVSRPDAVERKQHIKKLQRARKAARVALDESALRGTGIREKRLQTVFTTPNVLPPPPLDPKDVHALPGDKNEAPLLQVKVAQNCYICKTDFNTLHHFYDQLCPACGDFNFKKRDETADLRGRVALLTGGRVKIGYQAGIKLLRAGATLVVTTRFPRDAAKRYAAEADAPNWMHRLSIYGLDLRHTPSVEAFCRHMETVHQRLDFIVNNACQTVRRPPGFYKHMMEEEAAPLDQMAPPVRALLGKYEGLRREEMLAPAEISKGPVQLAGLTEAAKLSQIALVPDDQNQGGLFPEGRLDADLQQVDLRDRNSWRLMMHEVSTVELLEVQLVNAVAPYVLNARLKGLMMKDGARDKHIVNVSAMEGQFYRRFKTTRHPHTNMAKAALNMMTRTAATDYYHSGIHMNSVDTGWVTDEDPAVVAERKVAEHRFSPPLDIVDGAARIVDPIIDGFNTGVHQWGQFLKDYKPTDW